MEDHQIINNIKAGDSSAFKLLFDRHKDGILNLCYRIIGNRVEAEDICQDVFFKIYRSIDTFKAESKFTTWAYRIAVNHSLNHVRRRKNKTFLSLSPTNDESGVRSTELMALDSERPDHQMENKDRAAIVRQAINRLPKQQQTALILQKYQGLSAQEIADLMEWSLPSVQSRLHRARLNLCKKLKPYWDQLK